ncbi:MAG: hypothetical protein K2H79_05275 [Bacteroidaceae bacterium]|nr:hypothetical protein [Bacteroidaceae bacterium]
MKNFFLLIAAVAGTLLCTSCEQEEDYGYPSKITLSGKGETTRLSGDEGFPPRLMGIDLLDYNGNGNHSRQSAEGDTLIVTTKWLTVKSPASENKLILMAEPNDSHKKRKLYLYLYYGGTRQEVTVVQSK